MQLQKFAPSAQTRLHSCPPSSQSLNRRGRTARKHERLTARSAVAAPASQTEDELDLRTASTLLLVYESFRRATGRPMVDCKDLLEVPDKLRCMPCCLVLVDLPPPHHPSSTAPPSPATAHPHGTHTHGTATALQQATIAYANAPAQQLLWGQPQQHNAQAQQGTEPSTQGQTVSRGGSDDGQGLLSSSSSSSSRSSVPGCQGVPLVDLLHDGQALQPALQACELQPGESPHCWWHRGLQWLLPHDGGRGHILTNDCLLLDVASPSGKVSLCALLFDKWSFDDGRIGRPYLPALLPSEVPTSSDLTAAEDAVRAQADAVRALKVQEGLSNQDPRVVSAVAELQARKHKASSIQAVLLAFSDAQGQDDVGVKSPYTVLEGL